MEKVMEDMYGRLFQRMDRIMREEKLYLDYRTSLVKIAERAGTNRTYASRAVCSRYRNFKEYVNRLRIENMLNDEKIMRLLEERSDDPDDFANKYGFRTRRTMDRVLLREKGYTYGMVRKKRNL